MFASGMSEAASHRIQWEVSLHALWLECVLSVKAGVFCAQTFSEECLRSLLLYLYTDTLLAAPVDAIELFCVADMYCLAPLKALCESRVSRAIAVSTAADLFGKASEWPACSTVRAACLRFIVSHFDAVSKTAGFESLSRDLIIEIIKSR
jgi:hypothetical protein